MVDKMIRVLVANASEAHLYNGEALRNKKQLRLVKDFAHPDSRKKVSELVSDGDGAYKTDKSGSGSYTAKHSPKEVEAGNFIMQLVKELKIVCNPHVEDELIVVMPAYLFNLFQKHWHCKFTKFIHFDKDYTSYAEKRLAEALHEHLYG